MEQAPGTSNQETVEGVSGLKIFFRSWRPDGEARGAIVIVPGFNAHSGYYGWVAEQFVADGLAVYAVDLRGRGNSDGERFYVETFEDYVRDVEAVMAIVKSRTGPAHCHAGSQRGRCRLLPLHPRPPGCVGGADLREFCSRVAGAQFRARSFQRAESRCATCTCASPPQREIFSRPQSCRGNEQRSTDCP